jgi:hypothetical protein
MLIMQIKHYEDVFLMIVKGLTTQKTSKTFKCRVKPLVTSFTQPKDLGAL